MPPPPPCTRGAGRVQQGDLRAPAEQGELALARHLHTQPGDAHEGRPLRDCGGEQALAARRGAVSATCQAFRYVKRLHRTTATICNRLSIPEHGERPRNARQPPLGPASTALVSLQSFGLRAFDHVHCSAMHHEWGVKGNESLALLPHLPHRPCMCPSVNPPPFQGAACGGPGLAGSGRSSQHPSHCLSLPHSTPLATPPPPAPLPHCMHPAVEQAAHGGYGGQRTLLTAPLSSHPPPLPHSLTACPPAPCSRASYTWWTSRAASGSARRAARAAC